ncbi:MAG: 50S ribosomal protein L35 [Tissierellia bacterium]|nr:50S ribosomal protein L35 [Tissierellia bacterium]
MAVKMKTHKGAAKRFKRTGTGKIKRYKAYKSHLTGKKSPKRVRNLRKSTLVSKGDQKRIDSLLPR